MDLIYDFGIRFIQFIQYNLWESKDWFVLINKIADPHCVYSIMFPFIAAFDSVFASQYLLCVSFAEWLNVFLKWVLAEDRPYWWIYETSYYTPEDRPKLLQYKGTCETGPGSPSGHLMITSTQLVLFIMFISHIMNDRKCYKWWVKYITCPLSFCMLVLVTLSRTIVAAHFIHQCFLGILTGLFISPILCIYLVDPYVWGDSVKTRTCVYKSIVLHLFMVSMCAIMSLMLYYIMIVNGVDPLWTVKLAYKYCEDPSNIKVTTTPYFSYVECFSSMLGWAVFVTPSVAKFRHYTKKRSLILSGLSALLIENTLTSLEQYLNSEDINIYIVQSVVCLLRVWLHLRAVPFLSRLPFIITRNS